MLILSAVQGILACAFILLGLVALFGIGITGLVFLAFGAVFAATAAMTEKSSRAGAAAALAVDAVLAYIAARKLEALLVTETADIKLHQTGVALQNPGFFDYFPPSAALVLVGIAVVAVARDWRALRNSPWF